MWNYLPIQYSLSKSKRICSRSSSNRNIHCMLATVLSTFLPVTKRAEEGVIHSSFSFPLIPPSRCHLSLSYSNWKSEWPTCQTTLNLQEKAVSRLGLKQVFPSLGKMYLNTEQIKQKQMKQKSLDPGIRRGPTSNLPSFMSLRSISDVTPITN